MKHEHSKELNNEFLKSIPKRKFSDLGINRPSSELEESIMSCIHNDIHVGFSKRGHNIGIHCSKRFRGRKFADCVEFVDMGEASHKIDMLKKSILEGLNLI